MGNLEAYRERQLERAASRKQARARIYPDRPIRAVPGRYAAGADEEIVRLLIGIFENVLETGPLGAHSNFFDKGGDSVRAVRATRLVQEATGRRMSVSALRDAPSPAELAFSLAGLPLMAGRYLITLNKGMAETPLFLVSGVAGPALDELDLTRTMFAGHTVYGFQIDSGSAGIADAPSVERIASLYLADVRRVQPSGPYAFAGFSFGGLVALEMARAVRAAGERVALVALVDSFPAPEHWGMRSRVGTWLHRRASRTPAGGAQANPARADSFSAKANLQAAQGYHPEPYDGHVTFVRSGDSAVLPSKPEREWERFANSVEVINAGSAKDHAPERRLDLIAQALEAELLPYPRIDLTMI